jgi:hypothetical protein
MGNEWIATELREVNLNDKRLNERFAEVLQNLSQHPNVSIPAACGGYAETMAAYRFFDNEKVTKEAVLQPHRHATKERVAVQDVVLCVQDTTELDLTRPQQQIRGLGPIGTTSNRRGGYLHLLTAFAPGGTPLGTLWDKWIIRKDETPEEKAIKKKTRQKTPIEEKESYRWLEGWRQTIQLAKEHPGTTCVCIGDSESDIFEVFAESRATNAHFLIRAYRERNVTDENDVETKIRKTVYATPVLATKTLSVRARPAAVPHAKGKRDKARTAREALMEIRKTTLHLQPPTLLSQFKNHDPVEVNVVLLSEAAPPSGETAIEWMLLTTLPIDTLADVLRVIEYYECRWMIEIFFKTLKSGCKVESLQFEETSRLEPCLGVYLIVAWRVLFVCRLGRSHPDWSCEILFDESEWKSTFRIMHPKKKLPAKPPNLNFMLRLIGELGGWVSTPGKEELPGPQTTWIGLQRMHDFAKAWNTFGPGAKNEQENV